MRKLPPYEGGSFLYAAALCSGGSSGITVWVRPFLSFYSPYVSNRVVGDMKSQNLSLNALSNLSGCVIGNSYTFTKLYSSIDICKANLYNTGDVNAHAVRKGAYETENRTAKE